MELSKKTCTKLLTSRSYLLDKEVESKTSALKTRMDFGEFNA